MGYVAPALQLVATGTSAYAQYKGGRNAADTYEYNQQIAKYQAKYAKDRGEVEVSQLNRDVARFISRNKAIAGRSGTVSGAGSNADVLDIIGQEGDIDAAIIRYNASNQAYAANQNASLLGTQADQYLSAGYLNAGSTLLNSASKYDWRRFPGLFRKTPKNVPTIRGGEGGGYGF